MIVLFLKVFVNMNYYLRTRELKKEIPKTRYLQKCLFQKKSNIHHTTLYHLLQKLQGYEVITFDFFNII